MPTKYQVAGQDHQQQSPRKSNPTEHVHDAQAEVNALAQLCFQNGR